MKRLVMVCVAVAAMGATTFAQGRDLSGTWAIDVEKSGAAAHGPRGNVTITLTAKDFTIAFSASDASQTHALAFKLDGTETDLGRGGKGSAAWKGDKLTATMTSAHGTQALSFWRQGSWLVNEEPSPNGPVKVYFRKAPAK